MSLLFVNDVRSHGGVNVIPGTVADLPFADSIAAIDLGFGATRSCGLAILVKDSNKAVCSLHSFGECVNTVAGKLRDGEVAALVIEAPLSGVFSKNGDPSWRSPFERQPSSKKGRAYDHRYWYVQPGATVCLAAVAFLRQLSEQLTKSVRPPLVFEGFFTFKPKGKSNHLADAQSLAWAARNPATGSYYTVQLPEGGRLLSVLIVAGVSSNLVAPAIVATRRS